MGTPDFAVPTLNALNASELPVKLVVTQPDRPKGRGRKRSASPIKIAAQSFGYNLSQPYSVREPEFIEQLKAISPDFLVVVAFGQILPASILTIPKRGAINVHASLLPKYRGPAPIQWAMIRGEQQTGITTMLLDHGVDTGDMLLTAKTRIEKDDTAESLHNRLALIGADLLVTTINKLWEGDLFPTTQKHDNATYAPMLKKQDGLVDWTKSAVELDTFVRAMTPWPGAFCYYNNIRLRLFRVKAIDQPAAGSPGSVEPSYPDDLRIATGNGILSILEIQGESGKRMAVRDYLRGHPMPAGSILKGK
jgi:methionyl-tRNA formyltransferase